MLGGFLALLAAATFAFNAASSRRAVLTGTVAQGMAVTVPLGVPIFLAVAVAAGSLGAVAAFPPATLFWLSLAGVIHFVWGRYCNYRTTKAIGANLAGTVQQFDIVLSLALAMWILDETLTPLKLIGIVLIFCGVALPPRETAKPGKAVPPADAGLEPAAAPARPGPDRAAGFKPNYAEGYLWGLLTMTGYGVSPIVIRYALGSGSLGTSIAGGLVSYLAATLVLALFLLRPGQVRHVLAIDRVSLKWFTLTGVLVCVSQMFRYMALAVAPVTVVQPIQRLSLLIRFFFGYALNREHEIFSAWVVIGALVSLVGALALSVSTEIVLSLVPLPDWLVAVARWQWP